MKQIFPVLLVALLALESCQVERPEKYAPRSERKREKYATPEPGTYLKPVAYAVLNEINKAMDHPDTYKQPSDWVKNMFVSRQKKLVDTTLQYNSLEIPVRIYYPSRESLKGHRPVILFLHGGGFMYGSVDEYHIMVSKLARTTGWIIVSADYRLAPEYPFPSGMNDCYAVLCWLQEHGAEIGADSTMICVMGDSAGGNLATVLTLRCRDDGRPQPHYQVLIYPGVTFVDTLYPSRQYFACSKEKSYVLTEEFMKRVKSQYLTEKSDERDPYLSPLEADLTPGLAPALIITAECDPIRDGGRLYAENLKAAGVEVDHIEYSGMIHGFMSFHMVFKDASSAMKYIRNFISKK